ncbi:MAG TPA: PilZ domain-containing protein [Candidatus Angelobacter sp.]|nr:PilZ domain-containing protein [Candidatus Angelobacter sp.]
MHAKSNQSFWEFLIAGRDARTHTIIAAAIHEFAGAATATSDTAAAMASITRRKLDGIFIDMGIEGALNLIGSVRRGSSNRLAVVFACAGEHEDSSRLLNAGANFVVHKPLDPAELATVLRSARQMMAVERQRYLRHDLALPVILKTTERDEKAVTLNISRGGMTVRCPQSLVPGSALHFVLELPVGKPVSGRGEVAWANTDGQMGIRFYLVGEEVKTILWHWMEERTIPASS